MAETAAVVALPSEAAAAVQRWVLAVPEEGDPFDLIDGFEVGAGNRVCRVVDAGRVILAQDGIGEEAALCLLRRELRDHS